MFDAALRALIAEAIAPLLEKIDRLEKALINPPADPNQLLTVREAAQIRGVSAQGIYKSIERGQLKVVRVGSSVRIPRRELH